LDQPILWSPNADTGVVILAAAPGSLIAFPGVLEVSVASGDTAQGFHAIHATKALTSHLFILPGTNPDAPLAALIPLDRDSLSRIEALTRFCFSWQRRPVPPDTRLTRPQRRRLRLMLQAVDGRLNGATYREIARVIYGVARIDDAPWKTSPLRDSTIALVRNGLAMIDGGYRQLLRHRRRS
jgi:hypothetical protein